MNIPANLNRMIDHTLLKPEATSAQIETLCKEALHHQFAAVCVNPIHLPLAARILKNSPVAPITVIGFPLGANWTSVKLNEAERALQEGAQELDWVLPISWSKEGKLKEIADEMKAFVSLAQASPSKIVTKVILETALLTDQEILATASICVEAGVGFLKTSTGFAGGATAHTVKLLKSVANTRVQVKASGGIRNINDALVMIEAGATRLGTSAGVAIVTSNSSGPLTRSESGSY